MTTELEVLKMPASPGSGPAVTEAVKARLPVMYLEMVENKNKVDRRAVTRPYRPPPAEGEDDWAAAVEPPPPVKTAAQAPFAAKLLAPGGKPAPVVGKKSAAKGPPAEAGSSDESPRPSKRAPSGRLDSGRAPDSGRGSSGKGTPASSRPSSPASSAASSRRPSTVAEDDDESPFGDFDPSHAPPLETESDPQAEEDRQRAELYLQYQVLKRMYPEEDVPEMTAFSDVTFVRDRYKTLVRRLALDKCVTDWKKYLVVFMCAFELVMGKLNFNVEGFARHQLQTMNVYDELLGEMANKYYLPETHSPVELRLATTVGMNVLVFMLGRACGGTDLNFGELLAAVR